MTDTDGMKEKIIKMCEFGSEGGHKAYWIEIGGSPNKDSSVNIPVGGMSGRYYLLREDQVAALVAEARRAEIIGCIAVLARKKKFYEGATGYWDGYIDCLDTLRAEYEDRLSSVTGEER